MASMKLRVRAASGGATTKVQIPLLCTLQGLKDVLGPLISMPASSFSLSLNKKDEIQGPGTALLSSFGVTSGDLLFYIVNSGRSSPIPLTGSPASRAAAGSSTPTEPRTARPSIPSIEGLEPTPSRGGRAASTPNTRRELCAAAAARRAAAPVAALLAIEQQREIVMVDSATGPLKEQAIVSSGTAASISPCSAEEGPAMNVQADEKASLEVFPRGGGHRLVPIPDLLQRVLNTESNNIRQPSMFLVLSVHAVMLETGFLRIDGRSTSTNDAAARAESSTVEGYELPSGWSSGGLVNLSYTLPELAGLLGERESGQEALLRCQIVGNAVVVYGAVTGGSVHRVSLSFSKFLQESLKSMKFDAAGESSSSSSSGGKLDTESVMEDVEAVLDGGRVPSKERARVVPAAWMGENVFRDIFELWKEVKDSLSLPLLTFMCEATGLPPPPSLLRLPTELKIKVLDSLPSVALANLACACSEFRFLAANEELWKQKYREEFGASSEKAPGGRGWKSAFVREFEHRRRREYERREAETRFLAEVFTPGVALRPPSLSPHFGDFFQGLGAGPSQYDLPRARRVRRMPSENHGGAFFSMGVGSSHGDLDGFCFPDIDFHGRGERAWPPVNNAGAMGTRIGFGRMDQDDFGNGGGLTLHPHHGDGGEFQGLGPSS